MPPSLLLLLAGHVRTPIPQRLDIFAGAAFTVVAACFPLSIFELFAGASSSSMWASLFAGAAFTVGCCCFPLSLLELNVGSLSFSFFQRLGASMLIRSGPVRLGGQTIRQKTQTVWQLLESNNR